jgi:hypothetical protein
MSIARRFSVPAGTEAVSLGSAASQILKPAKSTLYRLKDQLTCHVIEMLCRFGDDLFPLVLTNAVKLAAGF